MSRAAAIREQSGLDAEYVLSGSLRVPGSADEARTLAAQAEQHREVRVVGTRDDG